MKNSTTFLNFFKKNSRIWLPKQIGRYLATALADDLLFKLDLYKKKRYLILILSINAIK